MTTQMIYLFPNNKISVPPSRKQPRPRKRKATGRVKQNDGYNWASGTFNLVISNYDSANC